MDVTQLFAVWLGRWRAIATCVCAFALAALIVCLLLPKQYSATSALLVDTGGADVLSTSNDRAVPTSQTIIATQTDLVTSERVARRVVAKLGLASDARWRERWMAETGGEGNAADVIATLLLKKLDVKPNKDSTVINISFRDTSDKGAAEIANAFAQATVDAMLELKVEPARQYAGWFDKRADGQRATLDAAQSRLATFQREHGLINTGPNGQIDIETAKLSQLTQQLLDAQSTRTETSSREIQANRNSTTSPDVLNSPVILDLRSEVAKSEAYIKELQSTLGNRHPQVVSARLQLDTLKAQLETEMRAITRSLKANDQVSQRREVELRHAAEVQRQRVLDLTKSSNELAVLQRDVENAQKSLDLTANRQAQTSLESQIQQTNVLFLTPAVTPPLPSSPKIRLAVASAAAFGLIIGLALALWLEMRAPLVRSVDDLAVALDLPVIAVISTVKSVPQQRPWLAFVPANQRRLT